MKRILALILALFMIVGTFVACDSQAPIEAVQGDKGEKGDQGEQGLQGEKGDKGDQGDKGDSGRGILKTEIIDGYLWITYTDDPENPVNIGKVSSDDTDNNDCGLDFYPLPDGTYGVMAGKSLYLDKITIPATYNEKAVTQIFPEAFKNAPNLKEIIISDSVTSIGNSAFERCTGLTSVTIGNSVTSIGNSAFEGCTGLTSVTIGNSVTSIDSSAFRGCTSLTSVIIPDSVTSIGKWAFLDCTSLESITIPDSVTSIGQGVFSGCTGLTSVEFKNTEGWKADSTIISSTNLADKAKAVEYLTDTYAWYTWTRS